MCSRTLPSPPPPSGRGRVRLHVGYLGIPTIFQLVCHTFLSITFAFSCCSRSVGARNCRSDRRETGTQIGQKSKYRIIFFTKTENQMLKYGKSANRNENQNQKNRIFLAQKPKTDLKNSQNRKNRKSPCPPH